MLHDSNETTHTTSNYFSIYMETNCSSETHTSATVPNLLASSFRWSMEGEVRHTRDTNTEIDKKILTVKNQTRVCMALVHSFAPLNYHYFPLQLPRCSTDNEQRCEPVHHAIYAYSVYCCRFKIAIYMIYRVLKIINILPRAHRESLSARAYVAMHGNLYIYRPAAK